MQPISVREKNPKRKEKSEKKILIFINLPFRKHQLPVKS